MQQAAGRTYPSRRFERGVHVDGDVFRRLSVAGHEEMTPHAPATALQQLRLGYRLSDAAADTCADGGETSGLGIWLDTSEQTREETVDATLAAVG